MFWDRRISRERNVFFPDSWEGYYQKVRFAETSFLDAHFVGCPSICLSSKNPGVMYISLATPNFMHDLLRGKFSPKMNQPQFAVASSLIPPKKWGGISWCFENSRFKKKHPQGQQLNPPRLPTWNCEEVALSKGECKYLGERQALQCNFTPRPSGPLGALYMELF